MILTTAEYCVLSKIAESTKMDCWFFIKTNKRGHDYVHDLENGKAIGIRRGVLELADGIYDLNGLDLTQYEKNVFIELLSKLKQ